MLVYNLFYICVFIFSPAELKKEEYSLNSRFFYAFKFAIYPIINKC